MSVPGGPEVIGLVVSPPTITDGGTVTFTATVTDPDGPQDIIAGLLKSGDGAIVYGPFVQVSAGGFTASLTWSQLHQTKPIAFAADETRTFLAEFSDTSSSVGTRTAQLTLTCNGYKACDGQCASAANPDLCSGSCLSCAEYISDDSATIEDVCGYTAEGCEPGSSCEKLLAIGDCVCGPNQDGTGKCYSQCPVSCGADPSGDDSGCQPCALTDCGTEAQACLNDGG